MATKLTVYFDDPFWVGVFERIEDGQLSVCRITFGAEPKDSEVYDFVCKHYTELSFSPPVDIGQRHTPDTPKRRQKDARKQMERSGVGTKALQMQLEQNKQERKVRSREQKQADAKRQFALKQQKKKEKHKGR